MDNSLLLIGCGGHAKSIIDIIESDNKWNLLGLIGTSEDLGKVVVDYPVLGTDSDLAILRQDCSNAFISIGQMGKNQSRKKIYQTLNELNFNIPILKSKYAIVSSRCEIDHGTSVGHGCVINSSVKIGKNCIINSKALIEHDVIIGDFCHVSTGSLINGGVRIGSGSFIGSGTIIREGIEIPENTIISAGKRIMGFPIKEDK